MQRASTRAYNMARAAQNKFRPVPFFHYEVIPWLVIALLATTAVAQKVPAREKIIIDTDIGDDVDDAFALALALKSPELQILGISTDFGETGLRAQIVD